ncbi:GDP-D-glucose phosphorylase 1-like isoform X1 [Vespa mandarinia]|uniref:GDP-D-glucose phosphorylase 1-like isoform X1 n=1 Tax=Vespa mandarinia TaxID=7446 RepID=UPI00161A30AF|nr:GDP-D-glucose phosphorylase 1-like isoform X1 [Vespa mandarinia]
MKLGDIMFTTEKDIPNLNYNYNNFHFSISEKENESEFDIKLKQAWEKAQKDGVFRYLLNISSWRILEGPYRLLVQLNPDRAFKRRTPENITTMLQPFDPTKFNFTRLSKSEIMFKIENEDDSDIIAVNVSPTEWCHSLLIIKYLQCLPQSITWYSLQKAIEILLLSSSPYFRIAFNSLCAFASVNHLHWHLYYLKHNMLLEYIEVQPYQGSLFLLENFPSKGFCFKLSSSKKIETFVSSIFSLVNYLQKNQIAHNVYVTRAKTINSKEVYDDVRAYVWARKSHFDVKNTTLFNSATCELFGHIFIKTEEAYQNLTESTIAKILESVTEQPYLLIKKDLHKIM